MSKQSLLTCDCEQLIYSRSSNGCLLRIAKPFRPLASVFSTPSRYMYTKTIPDALVPTKVATSVYQSVPNPKLTCQYPSWQQLSPPNRATFGLSWLIDIPDSPVNPLEVIQFLTSQLEYNIEWKLKYTSIVLDPSPITFVPVQSGATVAFEAPDICGNRILFTGKSGSFVVPGQYGQFVISMPDRNVSMRLRVTGRVVDRPDQYFLTSQPSTTFYVSTPCGKVEAYTNTLVDANTVTIQRTVAPVLATLEALILKQYHAREFFPCFVPSTGTQPSQARCFPSASQMVAPQSGCFVPSTGTQPSQAQCFPSASQMVAPQSGCFASSTGTQPSQAGVLSQSTLTLVVMISTYFTLGTMQQNPNNFVTNSQGVDSCGISFINPTVPPGGIVGVDGATPIAKTVGDGDQVQFALQSGLKYRIFISRSTVNGQSPSYNDLLASQGLPRVAPHTATDLTYGCNPSIFAFSLYDVNGKVPVTLTNASGRDITSLPIEFVADPFNSDANSHVPFLLTEADVGEYTFTVDGDGSWVTFSTRISSPLWTMIVQTTTGVVPVYFGGAHDVSVSFNIEVVT